MVKKRKKKTASLSCLSQTFISLITRAHVERRSWWQVLFYLVQVVKQLKNGEDTGAYEETHLTSDIAWKEKWESL